MSKSPGANAHTVALQGRAHGAFRLRCRLTTSNWLSKDKSSLTAYRNPTADSSVYASTTEGTLRRLLFHRAVAWGESELRLL